MPEVVVKLPGTRINQPSLPRALQPALRGTDSASAEDLFLPAGLVKVAEAYDLSPGSRAAAGAGVENGVDAGKLVALELSDGVTLFLRADKLRDDLLRTDPGAVKDGKVDIGRLRDRGAATRGLLSDIVSKVFVLDLGTDAIIEKARQKAAEWLGGEVKELGATWLGTKALMWAIESQISPGPGVYRFGLDDGGLKQRADPADLQKAAKDGPMLLLVHGTGSSSKGSFDSLRTSAGGGDWSDLRKRFGDRIFAYEHRTMSESPIENAVELARALPKDAQLSLVTHSRGGLVGDLICLDGLDDSLISNFRRNNRDLARADEEDREHLRELRAALALKNLRIDRYVRVAAPARGTRLASANFDVFLSGLLSLIGMVPGLAGHPAYAAFKRIVLEIAKRRTDPKLVPGIEAMLPESPMGELLMRAKPKPGMQVAVVAGDIEGGGLLKRLGVLLTDVLIFDSLNNDLVVDTDSMYAGLARPGEARRKFVQGPAVSHFRYFVNEDSRTAINGWLTAKDTATVEGFEVLPSFSEEARKRAAAPSRGIGPDNRPVVVVIPGIMGSHLIGEKNRRLWFDPVKMAFGGLSRLQLAPGDSVKPEALFEMFYGDLCEHLELSHRVERFPYDWRKGVFDSGRELASRLEMLRKETSQPIRILAHSMGGLVTRAMAKENPKLWDQLIAQEGARFVMLGTPNQGSFAMVETLLGKGDNVRKLARLDQKNNLQQVLDIVSGFDGALQLLPKPSDALSEKLYAEKTWPDWKPLLKDFWFGDGIVGQPKKTALDDARAFWKKLPEGVPGPAGKIVYVFGTAPLTPVGVKEENGRLKMLGTPQGDGTVTWASGDIGGIGRKFSMNASHGEMADTREHFLALTELLMEGETRRLSSGVPIARAAAVEAVPYEPGPVPFPTPEEAGRALLGAGPKPPAPAPVPALTVSCTAGDLRYVNKPILVGHYEQDPLAGAEALIDRELVSNSLTLRHHLGLYAGPIGTATVVLMPQNRQEQLRGSYRGAVVAGLGRYGDLNTGSLEEAVRTGALRYLLHLVDNGVGQNGQAAVEVPLASLLVGYNSTTNISIEDSVTAVVRGVLQANRQFAESMKAQVRIGSIELVELYLDTALGAARALDAVATRLNADTSRFGARVEAAGELQHGNGIRPRLDAMSSSGYWPRLMVTDADQPEGECVAPDPKKKFAERLRFVYLGQRARAEKVDKQRQPGLIERLVEESITDPRYQKDFARTLFQTLVPHDFKEAARQMEKMLLVLDGYTANLPWEMMRDGDSPLAIRVAMVRQLASGRFRSRVRQTLEKTAYVIGNPSTAGFWNAFDPPEGSPKGTDLPPLEGAEREASAVASLLQHSGYAVESRIGSGYRAVDIINGLYQQPYRIVHIAAHGIHAMKALDGRERSGVVLANGLLITAAEIESMEIVPDLVFLNCCHLGNTGTSFNRLAYSVSRELIEMGVRAVVAAGWAVDDGAATAFAQEFYSALLGGRMPFGRALLHARRQVFERFGHTNTWGAYQAYGDPGFLMDPRADKPGAGSAAGFRYFSPEELLDQISANCARLARQGRNYTKAEAADLAKDVDALVKACPADWAVMPYVNSELARYYAELGPSQFGQARKYYLAAIRAEDKVGRVPIKAIEQLANLEAREGEASGDEALIDSAIRRLETLESLVKDSDEADSRNQERLALLASSYKRKAGWLASRKRDSKAALDKSKGYYREAEGKFDDKKIFRVYTAINRLGLEAVDCFGKPSPEQVTLARNCEARARENYRSSAAFWDAIGAPDAMLAANLLAGTMGEAEYGQLLEAYRDVLTTVPYKRKDLDSVTSHITLLATLFGASRKKGAAPIGNQLKRLAAEILTIAGDNEPDEPAATPNKRPKKTPRKKK